MPRKTRRRSDRKWAKVQQTERNRTLRSLRRQLRKNWQESCADLSHDQRDSLTQQPEGGV